MDIYHDKNATCILELSTMERIIMGQALRSYWSDLVSNQFGPVIDPFLSHIKEMVDQLEADPYASS